MQLLALIIAYLICHVVPKPQRFRNFSWFNRWSSWFNDVIKINIKEITVILIIAIPVIAIDFILYGVFTTTLGGLLISVLVLSYCIGPESIEEDVESNQLHEKLGISKNAKIPVLIKKMTQESLKRWFGVFFWYLVLGIVGALMYRFSERLDYYTTGKDNTKPVTQKLMKVLNYPVVWMMVLSLAIASDFERIFKKCKPFMNVNNVMKLDDTFLYDAADFAVENCEVEEEDKKSIEQVTIGVLKRMLVVWLVFVSILVIFVV